MPNCRLVVATDESPRGRHAVSIGRQLAELTGGRLTIVQAIESPDASQRPPGRIVSTSEGSRAVQLTRLVEWLGPDLGPRGPDLEVAVAFGVPGIEIGRLALLRDADLVILGRREPAESGPDQLGGTLDALIRRCDRPVLAVPEAVTSLNRIMAALDGSPRCRLVLDAARSLASMVNGELSAVTVERLLPDEQKPGVEVPRRGRSMEVHQLLSERDGHGRPPPRLSVRSGDPVQQILIEVAEAGSSVLVVGYRRGGPPKRVDPSEIGRSLLSRAPCAMLTVPL